MNMFNSVRSFFARTPSLTEVTRERRPAMKRSIAAALPSLGTSDIIKMQTSVDEVLREKLMTLRNSSRGMAQNNGHVRAFLRMVEHHVVGPKGIGMQNKARLPNGELDREANATIEAAYATWIKPKNCDVRGKSSFRAMQRLVMRTVARDGECFIRKVKNHKGSAHRFALQILPTELVDEQYWNPLLNIKCGIEFDAWGAPVAYYLRQDRASFFTIVGANRQHYLRLPADEMIHVFVEEYPDQSRGIPWICSAIIRLHQLGAYEEAELMAARAGALKGGFIKSPEDTSTLADGQDAAGNYFDTLTPGALTHLRPGEEFVGFDPTHPSGNFGPFTKASLRSISAAVGVSYNLMSNDLEGVNYSSIRVGVQEDREHWKSLQILFGEQFLDNVIPDWADYALLSGALRPLRASRLPQSLVTVYRYRGWPWVDPQKDIDAALTAINGGLRSREDVLAEQGVDFEELCMKLAEEQELMDLYKIRLGDPAVMAAQAEAWKVADAAKEKDDDSEDDQENDDGEEKDPTTKKS